MFTVPKKGKHNDLIFVQVNGTTLKLVIEENQFNAVYLCNDNVQLNITLKCVDQEWIETDVVCSTLIQGIK